jgi:hypothetical protein
VPGLQQLAQGLEVPAREVDLPRGVTVESRKRPELDALGGRVGSYLVYPSIDLEEQYNDNIFATDSNEESDLITRLIPRVTAESNWNQHALNFSAGADFGFYADNGDEDYEDYHVGTTGRLDISRESYLGGGLTYRHLHEERASPDDAGGIEPTEYDTLSANIRYFRNFGRIDMTLGAVYDFYDFDDVPAAGGVTIDNDDRDREEIEGSLRVGYEIQPNYQAFVEGTYNTRDYDKSDAAIGAKRDSDGYSLAVGAKLDFGGITYGDFLVGYKAQEFDASALGDVDGPFANADITWNVTPLTTVIGSLSGEVVETTAAGASGRLVTGVGVSVDHELLRNLILGGDLSYENDDFEGIDRTDENFRAGLDAKYMLNRYLYVSGGYSFRSRDSDVSAAEFTENIFIVRLRGQY